MKKLLSVLIAITMVMGSTAVFAAKEEQPELKAAKVKAKADQIQTVKAQAAELKVLKDTIKANSEKINDLRKEAKGLNTEVRKLIKELIKNSDKIGDIDTLKGQLKELKADRIEIAKTMGKVTSNIKDFKLIKKTKNSEKMEKTLTTVIDVQKTRIAALDKIIVDLKAMKSELSEAVAKIAVDEDKDKSKDKVKAADDEEDKD